MIPSQMLKGVLEAAILKIIDNEETYAYLISQKLEEYGFGQISEGTIYPIILRLQKNKYIVGKSRPSPSGPKRKYYNLTDEGKIYLNEFKENWSKLNEAFYKLFTENDKEVNNE
ncbi:PadR family transcriptional regulator [Helcococcus kunzii]|uniref:PadR family transcriptional regulator n=1 Tax=Helcococcus kunzii TaxID=40091 RepID=UPI0024ADDFF2|nr:PadR family transcriptional regulator [Helcococcus kunzii]